MLRAMTFRLFSSASVPSLALMAALMAALAGCANNRTVIELAAPRVAPATATAPVSAARVVRIGTISDDRLFEDAPRQADIPSLGEPANTASASVRAHAVGRERNGYGKAQGDVVLSERQDMRDVMRATVASALSQAGYRVDDGDAAAPEVDVHVRQFWSWVQPGFAVKALRSRIVAEVSIGGGPAVTVSAETSQSGQLFTAQGWTKAVHAAVEAWREQAVATLGGSPR